MRPLFGLDAQVFAGGVEAGAGFLGVQVAMAQDEGVGKEFPQLAQQGQQAGFLGQGAGVFRLAAGIQTAFVADADAVAVVVLAVGAYGVQGAAAVDGAVAGQVVVVADVFEAAVTDVVRAAGFKIKVPPLRGGGTMNDEQSDASHRLQAATGLESQGSGYGRGGGDDYFEDDLPNVVFLHKLGFLSG